MDRQQVSFSFHEQVPSQLRERKKIKRFLNDIFLSESSVEGGTVSIVFCSDEQLLKINQDFLNHDYYTDIITFELSAKSSPLMEADIYISIDRVRDNALQMGQPYQRELHRVIFHGVLHLCDFKDKNKQDQSLMRKKEDEWLSKYFD
ncbi:MAG: rRNA maturation RNase YbeY [Niabella sp.]